MLVINGGNIKHIAIPPYITDNLPHTLRGYQEEAIKRFLYYYKDGEDVYNEKGEVLKKSGRLLFQMATGSGKTLIMAALILEMYKRGYRNFWYFVNAKDIIVKTIDNFCNPSSPKCCFKSGITIDGFLAEVRQVDNFSESNRDAINIKLSTINELHQVGMNEFGGGLIKENGVTLADFRDTPIILIGDESHHFNAATKNEEKENATWEDSLRAVLGINAKNRLFEFTATADLQTHSIGQKYKDTLIYNYDLKSFRTDGYSKDIFTFSTDDDMTAVMLRAILVSEYRKHIASDAHIFLKPVTLFKSKAIKDSDGNHASFTALVEGIDADKIKRQFALAKSQEDSNIWNKTCAYFNGKEEALAKEIKADYDEGKGCVLQHDGGHKREDDERQLSTLEDPDNPVRAIFAVDMLSEGWDVLNLFDIVRLYDTRDGKWEKDGKYTAGKTTISEIQLIGRGARYYPFTCEGHAVSRGSADGGVYRNDEKYRRKFDRDTDNPLRAIEQMHYHCKHNPKYLSEIKSELENTGLIDTETRELFTLNMRGECADKDSPFQKKFVFENKRETKAEVMQNAIYAAKGESGYSREKAIEIERGLLFTPDPSKPPLEIEIATGKSSEESIFGAKDGSIGSAALAAVPAAVPGANVHLKEIADKAVIRAAINTNRLFTFASIKAAYPKCTSMEQYIDYLGERQVILNLEAVKERQKALYAVQCLLQSETATVTKEKDKRYGSTAFTPKSTKKAFKEHITRKKNSNTKRQSTAEKQYQLDFGGAPWYVYDDNYGTTDELSFVKWFSVIMTAGTNGKNDMERRGWSDIYLARNEGAVKIYNTLDGAYSGEGFEPDYVLFAKREDSGKDYVFYIEVKGEWTYNEGAGDYGGEQWKEDFLIALERTAKLSASDVSSPALDIDCKNYRLVGLPFYGERRQDAFNAAFKKAVDEGRQQ